MARAEARRTVAAEAAIMACLPSGWWGDQMVRRARSQTARRAYLHAEAAEERAVEILADNIVES